MTGEASQTGHGGDEALGYPDVSCILLHLLRMALGMTMVYLYPGSRRMHPLLQYTSGFPF